MKTKYIFPFIFIIGLQLFSCGYTSEVKTIVYNDYVTIPGPVIKTLNPPRGAKTGASFRTITIEFEDDVVSADNPENYIIEGDGAGLLRVISATQISPREYQLQLEGAPSNGSLTVSLNNMEDLSGDHFAGSSFNYNSDVVSPLIDSTTPVANTYINQMTNEIQVYFSENMIDHCNRDYYSILGPGLGTLSISGVETVSSSSCLVKLSGAAAIDGSTLSLSVNGMSDEYSNPFLPTTIDFKGDSGTPAIELVDPPSGSVMGDELGTVTVTFSENVLYGDDTSSYIISGPGSTNIVLDSVTEVSLSQYSLAFSGITENGEIRITTQNITDMAGNVISGDSFYYIRDLQGPEITSEPADNSIIPRGSFSPAHIIKFSEEVTGSLVMGNYSLTGSAVSGLRILFVRDNGANSVLLYIGGTPVNGTLEINISNIKDLEGNSPVNSVIRYEIVD